MKKQFFSDGTTSPENIEQPNPVAPATPVIDAPILRADEDMDDTTPNPIPDDVNPKLPAPLISQEAAEHFRIRWNGIQGKFVDEPRSAVQQADELVTEVISQLTTMFTGQHSLLEEQWKQGNDVSTEELRQALQHYRSFFNRLVA